MTGPLNRSRQANVSQLTSSFRVTNAGAARAEPVLQCDNGGVTDKRHNITYTADYCLPPQQSEPTVALTPTRLVTPTVLTRLCTRLYVVQPALQHAVGRVGRRV